jgi:hypothetical protein
MNGESRALEPLSFSRQTLCQQEVIHVSFTKIPLSPAQMADVRARNLCGSYRE